MKKIIKQPRRFTKVLISILITLVLVNGIYIFYDIKREIQINKEDIIIQIQSRYEYLDREIDELIQQNKLINHQLEKDYKQLNTKINFIPRKITNDKIKIEYKLRQAVVVIYNKTIGALGSGVTLKYKDKYYILTAGHMADSEIDILTFGENGQEIGELEIIKHSKVTNLDINIIDLLLLKPKNQSLIPKYYIELADIELSPPNEIYIVGNPAGLEDVLCEGRIIGFEGNFMTYINHTYFGNSGGGIFNMDGKLLGIVSWLVPINDNNEIPPYMVYGAVRLDIIREFLEDIE